MYSFPHLWNQTLLISQQPESFSCNKRIHLSRWARTYKIAKKKRPFEIPNCKGFKTFRFLNSDLAVSEVEAWTSQNPSFFITVVKNNGNLGKLSPNFEAFSNVPLFLGTKSNGLKKRKEEEKNNAVTTAWHFYCLSVNMLQLRAFYLKLPKVWCWSKL